MGLAVIAGPALDWLVPLPFLPAGLAAGWLGALMFVLALALFALAIASNPGYACWRGAFQNGRWVDFVSIFLCMTGGRIAPHAAPINQMQ
jgi:hypothetical protein